jgi:hypothetical protein
MEAWLESTRVAVPNPTMALDRSVGRVARAYHHRKPIAKEPSDGIPGSPLSDP